MRKPSHSPWATRFSAKASFLKVLAQPGAPEHVAAAIARGIHDGLASMKEIAGVQELALHLKKYIERELSSRDGANPSDPA